MAQVLASSQTEKKRDAQLTRLEQVLLILPALAGLVIGLFPVLWPKTFADVAQFPADDVFVYQLAGSATLGYGVVFLLGIFWGSWLAIRLPTIAVVPFNLIALVVCVIQIATTNAPYSVYLLLAPTILLSSLSLWLLWRYRGVQRPEQDLAQLPVRIFLAVGTIAAGTFGVLPLVAPQLGTLVHLHINAPFIVRMAGAASFGYAVMTIFAQRALSSLELRLPIVMAAIFNGVAGIVAIPFIFTGDVIVLPILIALVGLAVLVGTLIGLRRTMA
jgi:hypothetical protein